MRACGYGGYAFFLDPLRGKTPQSGLALFWRPAVFSCGGDSDEEADGSPVVLECGEEARGGRLANIDLREEWHPLLGKGATAGGAAGS